MSRKKVLEWGRRTKATAGIIATITGSAQAPPPAQMPQYLADQYKTHSKVQLEGRRQEIKRLTTKTLRPVPVLDKRDAKRLRGK
jgi:hypothetical protein